MFFKYLVLSAIALLVSAARIPGPEERIVGGHHIPIEYVPWQVSLLIKMAHDCGGVIHSERVILTAAHCLIDVQIEDLSVRAGSSHWSKGGQMVKVLKAISHPKFDYVMKTNDVAVLILESPLKFSAYVQKIALAEETPEGGTMSLVSGWGDTRYGAGFAWPILQGVHVAVLDATSCKKKYSEDIICADADGRDICKGDSGGPLVSLPDRKLIGIVSYGGCGNGHPGGYADVAYFRNWFKKTINENI
ncbi:trypsin epsilon-like [Drosophila biarmipes]|uniref:trypsin epsilon-like n=1 Tax=Drosophila biarmipes TaxID=125945 RepID=UPI0007E71EB6|nr:trypsin epsilon-like [Drosophila biarmipes]